MVVMTQGDGHRQLVLLKSQGYVSCSYLHGLLGLERSRSSVSKLPNPSVIINGFRLYSPELVARTLEARMPSIKFRAMAFDFIVGKYDPPSVRHKQHRPRAPIAAMPQYNMKEI
jgi:hypothetical protein